MRKITYILRLHVTDLTTAPPASTIAHALDGNRMLVELKPGDPERPALCLRDHYIPKVEVTGSVGRSAAHERGVELETNLNLIQEHLNAAKTAGNLDERIWEIERHLKKAKEAYDWLDNHTVTITADEHGPADRATLEVVCPCCGSTEIRDFPGPMLVCESCNCQWDPARVVNRAAEWNYSSYRATLMRCGQPFAILSENGKDALAPHKVDAILAILNRPTA